MCINRERQPAEIGVPKKTVTYVLIVIVVFAVSVSWLSYTLAAPEEETVERAGENINIEEGMTTREIITLLLACIGAGLGIINLFFYLKRQVALVNTSLELSQIIWEDRYFIKVLVKINNSGPSRISVGKAMLFVDTPVSQDNGRLLYPVLRQEITRDEHIAAPKIRGEWKRTFFLKPAKLYNCKLGKTCHEAAECQYPTTQPMPPFAKCHSLDLTSSAFEYLDAGEASQEEYVFEVSKPDFYRVVFLVQPRLFEFPCICISKIISIGKATGISQQSASLKGESPDETPT